MTPELELALIALAYCGCAYLVAKTVEAFKP